MTVNGTYDWWQSVLGTTEHPPYSNHTMIWTWLHVLTGAPAFQGQPYCGAGVVDGLWEGGWHAPTDWIGVYNIQSWAEQHSRWSRDSRTAKEGDVLVLLGPGVHCGWARGDAEPNGAVPTFETNTSPGSEGSQFDGGTTAQRVRSAGEVYGVCRIHDLLGDTKTTFKGVGRHEPQYRKESKRGRLHKWETGPRVEKMQRHLGIHADGYWGQHMTVAVHDFKVARGWPNKDGSVAGRMFIRRLAHQPITDRMPTLHRGAKGGAVRKLERLLNKHGHHIPVRGDYNDRVATVVHEFKVNHKMPNHDGGHVGQDVWRALIK